jgi:hypothetical protein
LNVHLFLRAELPIVANAPMGGIVRIPKLIALGLIASAAAVAAPPTGQYCVVVNGMQPNCRFMDEADCAQSAVKMNGSCIDRNAVGGARAAEPKDAGFCLVSQGSQKCSFFSAAACASAAQLQGGTCITRPALSTPLH